MGTLRHVVTIAVVLIATPARADEVARWQPYINEASLHFGVPASWIERVMRAESNGCTTLDGRPIRSRVGAIGLMQLMPATWADMRSRLALGNDPDDPHDNILAGTLYLRLMYDRFGYPGLFGAYNAGPGAYAEWLAGKRRLPGETVAYLETVAGTLRPRSLLATSAPPPRLFVVRRDIPDALASAEPTDQSVSLFAVRRPVP